MKKHLLNFGRLARVALIAVAAACLLPSLQAQQRFGGPGGGGGNFGNFGGSRSTSSSGGNNASASGGVTQREYPNSTMPGEAAFQMDPETHSIVGMADPATLMAIQNVISNLDRPKPQALIKVVFLEVQHDNDLDVGVEGSFHTQKWNIPGVQSSTAMSDFGLAGLNSSGA